MIRQSLISFIHFIFIEASSLRTLSFFKSTCVFSNLFLKLPVEFLVLLSPSSDFVFLQHKSTHGQLYTVNVVHHRCAEKVEH